MLTLFLPGEGGISPLIVYHVTKLVKSWFKSWVISLTFQAYTLRVYPAPHIELYMC